MRGELRFPFLCVPLLTCGKEQRRRVLGRYFSCVCGCVCVCDDDEEEARHTTPQQQPQHFHSPHLLPCSFVARYLRPYKDPHVFYYYHYLPFTYRPQQQPPASPPTSHTRRPLLASISCCCCSSHTCTLPRPLNSDIDIHKEAVLYPAYWHIL